MSRRRMCAGAAVLALGAATLVAGAAPRARGQTRDQAQPNIVVIMVDDQPVLDGRLLAYEPTVRDQIAAQGATFGDFHSESPLCCPARVGFLTGQHTHNHGVTDNAASLFDPAMTIATQLHGVGLLHAAGGQVPQRLRRRARPLAGAARPAGLGQLAPPWATRPTTATRCTTTAPGPPDYGHRPTDYSTDVIARKAAATIDAAPPAQPIFAWYRALSRRTRRSRRRRATRTTTCNASDRWWDPPSYDEADVSRQAGLGAPRAAAALTRAAST